MLAKKMDHLEGLSCSLQLKNPDTAEELPDFQDLAEVGGMAPSTIRDGLRQMLPYLAMVSCAGGAECLKVIRGDWRGRASWLCMLLVQASLRAALFSCYALAWQASG
jgi:hypothetical protein